MHEAGPARANRPLGLREDRHEGKPRRPIHPLCNPVEHIEVIADGARPNRAASDGADRRASSASSMIDLIGAKPVPVASRMAGISASRRKNWPKGSSTMSLSPGSILASTAFGKTATGDVADVQLDAVVVVRRVGHREVSPIAVGHQHLQILTGLEFRAHAIGKAQGEDGDIGRRPGEPVHGCGQGLAQRRRASSRCAWARSPRPSAAAPGTSARRPLLPAIRRLRTCTSPATSAPSQVWQTPFLQE